MSPLRPFVLLSLFGVGKYKTIHHAKLTRPSVSYDIKCYHPIEIKTSICLWSNTPFHLYIISYHTKPTYPLRQIVSSVLYTCTNIYICQCFCL